MTPNYKVTIITLVGRTASGKSTLGKGLARYLRTAHIEVSDVIRLNSDAITREGLAATSKRTKDDPQWLGKLVDIAIKRKLESKNRNVVVVTGIRELEVINYLRGSYNVWALEIKADLPVRYQRCLDDRKFDSADEFIRGEIRELDLGLQEVEDEAPFAVPTSPLTNPDRIVKAMAKLLRSKGAVLR